MAKQLLAKEVTAAMVEKLQARVAALKEKGMIVTEFDKSSAAEACKSVWELAYEKIGGGDAAKGEEIVNRIAGGEFR